MSSSHLIAFSSLVCYFIQVRKSAMALANLLDDKDEQVLKDACLGLCQLFGEGIQNDRIQAILEANVVPKLVALLRPSKSRSVPISVQSAALQVLGNVACGDDRQTQVVIDSDALPCLRALLSSSDRGIRKEVCWIVSNITESSHQVQDVLDADILPPLLKLLDNQDTACREDATWVLFNLSSNRDPNQIAYLAEKNGVRALCNLLACPKELDVLWKGCGTVAAVALKGLRNILISGHLAAASSPSGYNKMASLVAEAYGVERIDALTNHESPDVRNRARLILERMFGTESVNGDQNNLAYSTSNSLSMTALASPPPSMGNTGCSCAYQHNQQHSQGGTHYQSNGIYDINGNLASHAITPSHFAQNLNVEHSLPSPLQRDNDLIDVPGSSSGSSTDSDPEDDDSDSELIPPPPAPCTCVLCTDASPLIERRPRGRGVDDNDMYKHDGYGTEVKSVCNFCSGGGRLGDGRAGLAAKLGRAVRLGHSHCLAVILSRMTWSQRVAATEAPALLHPGGGPPDGGIGNTLPAIVLAAQLGKPECLALLLRKCRPDLDVTHGKKRLTALAWAAHKSFMRCCQLLIEYGANTATKCGDSVTALHLAASGGSYPAICKLLIDHNAPVNARSSKKQTPLCLASQKGSEKVVQILLEHGADANNEDDNRYTPLHLAALKGFEHCVDHLLRAGARVDTMTRKSITPLHYAVQGGFATIVRSLISAGAKVNCNNKPLLLIAADDGNVEVVQILLDAQATVNCKASIRAMLDKGTEVTDYLTPLHLASSKAHQEVVELLLRRGANVNEKTTKRKWTALDFAVLNGHAECAVTLLEHGAFVSDNCKTIGRNNWTLVQYAAHHGAKDVVRLLIQRLQEQNTGGPPVSSSPKHESAILSGSSTNRNYTDVEGLNGEYQPHTHAVEQCASVDYIEDDCEYMHEKCPHYERAVAFAPSAHRYDPRSLDGDEVGFGNGSAYGNSGSSVEGTSKSRRRVFKEDRQSTIRKKRELEANDARERLEEAMNQRSVSKLTEAIAHVSKLVLHLAASTGSDLSNGSNQSDHTDINGYDPCNSSNHVHSPGSGHAKVLSNPYTSNGVSSPVAVEVGLGLEVQKARKVLVALIAEEKRAREEKEREAADLKRENTQQSVKKAISSVLQGGDLRTLTRAITRAVRSILDEDDGVIVEANALSKLVSNMEKRYAAVKIAKRERTVEALSESLLEANKLYVELRSRGGDGALQRIFGGDDPEEVLREANKILNMLREKLERERQEERRAKDLEQNAKQKLEEAIKLNDIVALERVLKEASTTSTSKNSVLGAAVEGGKKVLTKWTKGERRKLRHACNTNDPEVIEKTVDVAQKLGVRSLESDIASAKAQALKLREQSDAVQKLNAALSKSDTVLLNEIRDQLTELGMFAEAEKARAELERLQKSVRARTLLEGAIEDAKKSRDIAISAISQKDGRNDVLEPLMSWPWPDVQRLFELSERAKKHGQSSHSLCNVADGLLKELAKIGRHVLDMCIKSGDARGIASMIAGYEKSFMSAQMIEVFDREASEKAISGARKRLAEVQAMDQASVKAESALVKVEYTLATSRRAVVRNRNSRSSRSYSHNKTNESQRLQSPKIGSRDGSVTVEMQLHSSTSSDAGDGDVSEIDGELQQLQSSETGSVRSIEGARPSVAKKSRAASYIADDSGTPEITIESSNALVGECSHYYRYKEGNTVLCARCGHLRSSGNPEWLARVKRRGSKLPSEVMGVPFGSRSSTSELGLVGMGNVAGTNSNFADLELDQNDLRFGRTGVNCETQPALPNAFALNSLSANGGMSSLTANCDVDVHTSLGMMMPVITGQAPDQNIVKMCGSERGHGRGQLDVRGLDGRLQRLGSSVYSGAVTRGQPRSVIVSSPTGSVYDRETTASMGGGLAPTISGQQNTAATYGVSGLSGLEKSKNGLRMGSEVGTLDARAMGVGNIIPHNSGRGIANASMVGALNECGNGGMDLGIMDFENENFGFDIDKIVDDNPLPGDEVGIHVSGDNGLAVEDVIRRAPVDIANAGGTSSPSSFSGSALIASGTGAGSSCTEKMRSVNERMYAR